MRNAFLAVELFLVATIFLLLHPLNENALAGRPSSLCEREGAKAAPTDSPLAPIEISKDGKRFVLADSGQRFIAWGFNYDHDGPGRLIEDYWSKEWPTVEEDFQEMKALGANVVRVHLQLAKFMTAADQPNDKALRQLARLVKLAEQTGLYLDITGLGCYHKKDIPRWYDELDEAGRWKTQAMFWESVAKTCAQSNAIFCYDLMNEPILPGGKIETDWLAGEFGGKHFVQRISLDLAGRTRNEVARAWVNNLVSAIRKHDKRHLITVGVIPWVRTFPGAKPLFYSPEVGEQLDFVSVHFYPKKGQIKKDLDDLAVYDLGKPLVIEEFFPLKCGMEEFDEFLVGSRERTDGYIGFYWGQTIEDYAQQEKSFAGAIMKRWLEYFRDKSPEILKKNQNVEPQSVQ